MGTGSVTHLLGRAHDHAADVDAREVGRDLEPGAALLGVKVLAVDEDREAVAEGGAHGLLARAAVAEVVLVDADPALWDLEVRSACAQGSKRARGGRTGTRRSQADERVDLPEPTTPARTTRCCLAGGCVVPSMSRSKQSGARVGEGRGRREREERRAEVGLDQAHPLAQRCSPTARPCSKYLT